MNIPSNKLKDLVTILSSLDPDANHHFTKAEVFDSRGRRYLKLTPDSTCLVDINELLDNLYEELDDKDFVIVEDIHTADEFIAALIKHLKNLHSKLEEYNAD